MAHRAPVRSMTGFASAEVQLADGRSLGIAVKSVNHRHLDLQVRLQAGMDGIEAGLRAAVKERVHRGHVELTVSLGRGGGAGAAQLDRALLLGYQMAAQQAAEVLGVRYEADLGALLRMPGVVTVGAAQVEELTFDGPLQVVLNDVLYRFDEAREREGLALAAALRESMRLTARLAEEAAELRAGVAGAEFARLREKMRALLEGAEVSEERLLTEAALLAGRGDIEEELVRLRTHVVRFGELLDAGGEVGRALDFLLQEMNREANTALSKTGASAGKSGLRLTEIGLAVKGELERAREQVQNLE